MIYDCFLYNGEKECLQIRCEELKPLNVTHVLVDSPYSFTGNKQRIPFFEMEDKSDYFEYNIQEWIVDELPIIGNAWQNEINQRNDILKSLIELNAKDDDIIIVSDVDEIPSFKAIKSYKSEMGLTALRMDNFWYKFNCLTERQSWLPARIITFAELKNSTPNAIRNSGYKSVIENAGWHWSYLGDADYIMNKLNSFSHQEYNKEPFNNKEFIETQIATGISLWGNSKFEYISLDGTFPKFLYHNQDKFSKLIQKV